MSSNLADKPSSANGPPTTREEMTWQMNLCLPMDPPTTESSTWQMNLLWPMDPTPTSKTSTWQTNLLWLMDPPSIENRCLQYCYIIHGRQTYFCRWTPHMSESRDALHTSTQKLADKLMLADGHPLKVLTSSGQEWQFHSATDI